MQENAVCIHEISKISLPWEHSPVADPGFVKRGGRESKFPAQAWKSRSVGGGGGGLRHIFPPEFFGPTFTLLGRGTVRLPDRPPGWQAKKKKKKKSPKKLKSSERRGGRGRFGPPPPWIRHCSRFASPYLKSWLVATPVRTLFHLRTIRTFGITEPSE